MNTSSSFTASDSVYVLPCLPLVDFSNSSTADDLESSSESSETPNDFGFVEAMD